MDLHVLILTTEQRDLIADILQRGLETMYQPVSDGERIQFVQANLMRRTIEALPVERASLMLTPTVR